jgi:putative phosphoribosyl transferase
MNLGAKIMFANRTSAGMKLAEKVEQYLSRYKGLDQRSNLLVVGLPRGGVPVAFEIARKFGCPLEVMVAKKLGYPGQPEFAIGAVSSDGVVVLNPDIPKSPEWQAYIEQERQRLLAETSKIERQFYELAGRKASSFKDKVVIVVDDGIATGMTAMAALETARKRGASYTILATPVLSPSSLYELRPHCHGVVAIGIPQQFSAVGQFYVDFGQTTNEEVVQALRESTRFVRETYLQPQEPGLKPFGDLPASS